MVDSMVISASQYIVALLPIQLLQISLQVQARELKVIFSWELHPFQIYFNDTCRKDLNFKSPLSILSITARDSKRIPLFLTRSPPPWKPFSITIPAPTSVAPVCLTISASPKIAQPFARKSSIMRFYGK